MVGNCTDSVWWLARRPWHVVVITLLGLGCSGLLIGEGYTQTAPPKPAASPSTAIAPSTTRPILQAGASGSAVVELQALLTLLGYYNGTVSGTYDDATATAVRQFQTAAGIQADGVTGLETWTRLLPPAPPLPIATPTPAPSSSNPAAPTSADAFPMPNAQATSAPAPTTPPAAQPAPKTAPPKTAPPKTPTPTATAATTVPMPILRVGMSGPAVTRLQERLKALGYLQGAIDGVFGPATETAVKAAQEKLQLTADGVVGPETWAKLAQ